MPIIWSTDPLVNRGEDAKPQTIASSGAFLETTDIGLDLDFWDGWESGSISLSEADAYALRDALIAVLPE